MVNGTGREARRGFVRASILDWHARPCKRGGFIPVRTEGIQGQDPDVVDVLSPEQNVLFDDADSGVDRATRETKRGDRIARATYGPERTVTTGTIAPLVSRTRTAVAALSQTQKQDHCTCQVNSFADARRLPKGDQGCATTVVVNLAGRSA